MSSGRVCEGYAPLAPRKKPRKPKSKLDGSSTLDSSSQSSDGSGSLAPYTAAPQPSTSYELKLALPRNNRDEVRSFRFFVEVTAPSLSGVFDSDFWNGDLPRACHLDTAIWHAVVCLGAVFESYSSSAQSQGAVVPQGGGLNTTLFALRQSNLAIRHFLDNTSRDGEKWRALAASILFTSISSIQGSHDQARIHLTAGRKILDELDKDASLQTRAGQSRPKDSRANQQAPSLPSSSVSSASSATPIPLSTLRTIVTILDLHSRALSDGPRSYDFFFATNSEHYNVWRYYEPPLAGSKNESITKTPTSSARPGHYRYATAENLVKANRAAESLFNGTMLTQARYMEDISSLSTNNTEEMTRLMAARQEPHNRCFSNLGTALRMFGEEMEGELYMPSSAPDPVRQNLTKAYRTLKLYYNLIRLFLFKDLESPVIRMDPALMADFHQEMLDTAEAILRLSYCGNGSNVSGVDWSASSAFIPTPSPTQALSVVAMTGIPQSNRRRAISLLRAYPRREGLWDTAFAAALAETVMAREKEIIAERRRAAAAAAADDDDDDANVGRGNATNVRDNDNISSGVEAIKIGDEQGSRHEPKQLQEEEEDDGAEIIDVLDRQYGTRAIFQGERCAEVTLCTWREWKAGLPGKKCLVKW